MKKRNKQIHCPYCGKSAVLRSDDYVYGDRGVGKHLYVCSHYPNCDAYVGVYENTMEPMGMLADARLRRAGRRARIALLLAHAAWMRIEAHRSFDAIWRKGILSRNEAYRWLQDSFCLRRDQAHIGLFSEYMCGQVVEASRKVLQTRKCRKQPARRAAA